MKRRKYPFLVTFAAEAAVVRYLNMYRDQEKEYGYQCSSDQLGWAAPIYVAETDERANKPGRALRCKVDGQYILSNT